MVKEKFPAAAQETLMLLLLLCKKYIKVYGVAMEEGKVNI
jgi:hypothetical protein